MKSLLQHLKNRLGQAWDELYEAGCMAEAMLEEGAGFQLVPVRASTGRARRGVGRIFAKSIPVHDQWTGPTGR